MPDTPVPHTHHVRGGDPGATPVVFIPGATLPMFVWDGLATDLTGFRTIRYDLLGRGGSAAPRTRYDAGLFDRQLTALLDGLGVTEPVHLVSLAFGALIAATFARRHPGRVRSLSYIAPDGFGVNLSPAARLLLHPGIGEVLTALVGRRILLSRLADYSDNPEIVADLRSRFAPHTRTPGFQRAVLSSVRNMPVHDAATLYRTSASVPTLLLWGRDDKVTPLPGADRLATAFPNATVRIFDDVGHLPQLEQREETTGELRRFLGGV